MALKLTRNVLSKFLPNHESVVEFENLFSQTNTLFSGNAFISLGGFVYLQNSADNVGIGTQTATTKLELVGTSKFTGDMILIGALTMTGNYGLTGDLTVNGTSIFNGTALDKDFTIKKLTSGNAYVYDAGTDTHAMNGAMNFDGTFVLNSTAVDKDFTIKKLTSGDAYIYDAGADSHVFNGATFLITVPADTATLGSQPTGGTDLAIATTKYADYVRNTRVTTTYTILITDVEVFGNTDAAGYTVTLPAGVQSKHYRIINTGTSGNLLTIAPNGAENLIGANSNFALNDGESLVISYNTTDGWY